MAALRVQQQEIVRLTQENQQHRQQAQPAGQGAQGDVQNLVEAVGAAVAASLAHRDNEPRARALIDVRGLGKPQMFKNTELVS